MSKKQKTCPYGRTYSDYTVIQGNVIFKITDAYYSGNGNFVNIDQKLIFSCPIHSSILIANDEDANVTARIVPSLSTNNDGTPPNETKMNIGANTPPVTQTKTVVVDNGSSFVEGAIVGALLF